MNLLNELKTDMLKMLELANNIGKYDQIYNVASNIHDKNYNEEQCNRIKTKLSELNEEYIRLKEKWF